MDVCITKLSSSQRARKFTQNRDDSRSDKKKQRTPQKSSKIRKDSAQESQTINPNSDGEAEVPNEDSLCSQVPSSGSEKSGSRTPKETSAPYGTGGVNLFTMNGTAPRSLRMATWNAQRISNKKLDFAHFLVEHRIDIALIFEKWLKPDKKFKIVGPGGRV
ncbi:hypothetical protein Trydic_g11732 [Trypoxylus dichotomus]